MFKAKVVAEICMKADNKLALRTGTLGLLDIQTPSCNDRISRYARDAHCLYFPIQVNADFYLFLALRPDFQSNIHT